jgi:uncharacterized repeat protein (TIGR01451 family)
MAIKFSLTAMLLIFVFLSLSTVARAADDIEWVEQQGTVQLYWGDSVTVDDYVIKAEDFSNTSVFISISKDGEKLTTSILSEGMDVVWDDEIRVCAQTIDQNYGTVGKDGQQFQGKNKNPYAELNISKRGEPKFDIQVETSKDIYDSKLPGDSKIDVAINAENSGDAEAKNTVLTIDTAGLEILNGKAEYSNSAIKKGESLKPINLTLKTPAPWEDTNFIIVANLTCADIKDTTFEYNASKNMTVQKKWDLIVTKSFPEECDLGENVPISITVRNKGLCDIKHIVLNDTIVPGMHLLVNKTLKKTFSLKPGEKAEKILEYSLVPEAPGEYTILPCTAVFTLPNGQRNNVSSNDTGTVKINEPDVNVTKIVDKKQLNVGDNLSVTITAVNKRNANLDVRVNDTLPPGAKLLSGETSSKQILKSDGGTMSINYTIQMNTEGEIKLPACKANFTDITKNSVVVFSDTPIVQVGTPISLAANNTTKYLLFY